MQATLAVCVTAWALSAQAALDIGIGDTLQISGTVSSSYRQTGQLYYNGSWLPGSYYAGAFDVFVNNLDPTKQDGRILTFCTDILSHWQSPGTFTAVQFGGQSGVNPNWSATPESIQNAAWIYNNFIGGISTTTGIYNSNDKGAGLQLAIWKVLYDTVPGGLSSANLSSGVFRASAFGDGRSYAETVLIPALNAARSPGGGFTQYIDTWLKPASPSNNQGLIWSPITPVPEPGTLLAGALLLLPFGASTIRFIRKSRTA